MKEQIAKGGEWEIRFHRHPWIHPEDAAKAIQKRLEDSRKRRKKVSEEVIYEGLFLSSLASDHRWNLHQIGQIRKLSDNKNFKERFARALEQGRSPTFDKIDIFILQNWRELRFKPEIKAKIEAQEGKLPGLSEWSPKAIAGLFELAKINPRSGNFENWFTNRRKRLGLVGKYPRRIRDFIFISDSIRMDR